MDFSTKCNVLGELWLYYREDAKQNEAWENFFTYNDVSLPLSYGISQGYVELIDGSGLEEFIDESWDMFCEYISIDPNGNYEGINDAWAASSQPPLEDVDRDKEQVLSDIEVKPKRTRKGGSSPSS